LDWSKALEPVVRISDIPAEYESRELRYVHPVGVTESNISNTLNNELVEAGKKAVRE
jgi:hypothetical protein